MSVDCQCDGEDPECECQLWDHDEYSDEHSNESCDEDRSYDRSDADYYCELRDDREERKRELRELRDADRKEREDYREFESGKEKEVVQAALQIESSGDQRHLDSIAGKNFRLYSVELLDHTDDLELFFTKYISFYHLEEDGSYSHDKQAPDGNPRQVYGHVYFNSQLCLPLEPFLPSQ